MRDLNEFLTAFGFTTHPFAQKSAEEEPDLPGYFVRGAYFNRVLGQPEQTNTTLFFAARGNGKSSMAHMVNYQLREASDTPILVVNFGREAFDEIAQGAEPVSQSAYRASLLTWAEDALTEQKSALKKAFPPLGSLDLPPATTFRNFSRQVIAQGLTAIYVLVDGIDELPQTANNPARASELILPLVSDLILLETPRVVFKFFLPLEIKPRLVESGKVRFDRFEASDRWDWTVTELSELLELRLAYFSTDKVVSRVLGAISEVLDIDRQLCEAAQGSPRNLIRLGNYLIEEHLAQDKSESRISEKALHSACARLQQELKQEVGYSSSTVGPVAEVEKPALEPVAEVEKPVAAPSNRLSVRGLDTYIGETRLEPGPTGLELRVLTALYQNCGNTCSKDDLIEQAYEDQAASDEQLNAVIKRLRKKLKEPSPQYYVKTVWGEGFRLVNCT